MNNEFHVPVRVYIEDTDAGGIVYYVNYLKFMERACTEFFRTKGFNKPAVLEEGMLVVVSTSIAYKKPEKLDHLLQVNAKAIKIARSHIVFEQKIYCDGLCLTEAEIKVACVQIGTMRLCAFPARIAELINA